MKLLRFRLLYLFITSVSLFFNNIVSFKNNHNFDKGSSLFLKKNSYISYIKISNKKYDGYDMRYIDENNFNNSVNSSIILYETKLNNYREIFNKYKLYKLLKNENVSINIKLELIKEEYVFNDNIVPNITKGGLYKDWDFL